MTEMPKTAQDYGNLGFSVTAMRVGLRQTAACASNKQGVRSSDPPLGARSRAREFDSAVLRTCVSACLLCVDVCADMCMSMYLTGLDVDMRLPQTADSLRHAHL